MQVPPTPDTFSFCLICQCLTQDCLILESVVSKKRLARTRSYERRVSEVGEKIVERLWLQTIGKTLHSSECLLECLLCRWTLASRSSVVQTGQGHTKGHVQP